ncbi:ABC transporter permease subunit [Marivirga sp.]|uniref:ABC transporter permease subunit n=1 Tax=Marivirga sp. TaxID=2018662 RepID=UPI002D8030A6|nr:ABC transporter permease subunit [Marivirga sp.]
MKLLLSWMADSGAEFEGISPDIIPFYNFPDVWQNLTYLASYIKFFLAFIVIISVTNEYSYRTIRQNIIDGMSPTEFLLAKQSMIFGFSLFNMVVIGIAGTLMGLFYGSSFSFGMYFTDMEFLLAHFLELVTFLNLAMLISILLKKAGFAIIALCFYAIFLEPALVAFLNYKFDDHWLITIFPIHAVNNLIEVPFQRYVFMEIQDYVKISSALIAIAWLTISIALNYVLIAKRDVG